MRNGSLSQRDKVLLEAIKLPQPFSEAMLAIASWKQHPDDFGLAGFKNQFPDSNRIRCIITKSGIGLIAKKLIKKVGPLCYEVTRDGRRAAASMEMECSRS